MIQAYNYMLETFPMNREVQYPANKRSELKRVYNSIVDLSKRLPLYKINLSKENQEYTIGVKEAALAMKAKLNEMSDPEISGFQSKTVSVSDKNLLSAELMNTNTEGLPDKIQLKVNAIASVQVNRGRELLKTSHALPPGEYRFQAKVKDETYNLTYVQDIRMGNQESLNKVTDFLNRSLPGIYAMVEDGSKKDYSRITVISEMTGRYPDDHFSFEDLDQYKEGIVDFFGLNRMEKEPANAKFELNEIGKQTASNTFTLENKLRITLHDTGDQPVTLRIVPDSEKILSAVDSVLSTYNNLIGLAKNRTLDSKEHYKAEKLMNEMKSLEKVYKDELESCGLKITEDGILEIDEALSVQAAEDGGMENLFTRENGFIARLIDKADAIAINPMEYLDKTIVTYPDHSKNSYRNPYVTSMYSGLFFSSYC